MDKVAGEDTRLCYVTTGVLLQKLINQKNMLQYTHVVLDEVRIHAHLMLEEVRIHTCMSYKMRYEYIHTRCQRHGKNAYLPIFLDEVRIYTQTSS